MSTWSLTKPALVTVVSARSFSSAAIVITIPFDVVKTRIILSAAIDDAGAAVMKKVQSASDK